MKKELEIYRIREKWWNCAMIEDELFVGMKIVSRDDSDVRGTILQHISRAKAYDQVVVELRDISAPRRAPYTRKMRADAFRTDYARDDYYERMQEALTLDLDALLATTP